jgi:flagellin
MSLGVLNNLNAIYAEGNLNNTSASLSKTLQQLSSGSKINSGADDAAGLSLVNGLQANATALAQSQTNATEGVGLLQVADGALSQVTSLLNRAVTLATEASNGTLNSSQDTAANQEYQSILSEISNIGSTTTYNDSAVFGSNTNIYTGDSSTAGASIDSLNIRSLSSSNVGDTNGSMSYSNGGNNVFIDFSKASGGGNAGINDSLGAADATTTVTVNYLQTSTGGSTVAASKDIVVGNNTSYSNSVSGLISAINGSGLGLSASLTTASAAGDSLVNGTTVLGTDTGIEISGGGVSLGTTPGVVGTLSISKGTGGTAVTDPSEATDQLQGNVTIVGSDNKSHVINLTAGNGGGVSGYTTMDQLASTINSSGWGVTASVVQTGTGTTSAIATMTLTSNNSNVTADFTNVADITSNNSVLTPSNDVATGTGPAGSTRPAPAYYAMGVSFTNSTTSSAVIDDVTNGSTTSAGHSDTSSTGGTATISYTDAAGQSLSSTNLSNQTNAQASLTALNSAITAVAAQDGYIGAQINTLNAVSQVLSTQSQNVTAAQNAVQATDYASATSNMSKYEILSQTGISALAQANSMQQEVTKLLQ